MKKPVDCIHLSPPKEKVKRWHCDMGDGREGDCPIFLGKSEDCNYLNWKEETTMSEEHDADNPYITMTENSKSGNLAVVFFGTSLTLAALAIPFPFFRGVFAFASIILAVFMAIGAVCAGKDFENGVKRVRPKKWGSSNIPKWFKIGFFLAMIGISAGLKLGFYLVPIAWLISWIAIYGMVKNIEKTFPPKIDKSQTIPLKEGELGGLNE